MIPMFPHVKAEVPKFNCKGSHPPFGTTSGVPNGLEMFILCHRPMGAEHPFDKGSMTDGMLFFDCFLYRWTPAGKYVHGFNVVPIICQNSADCGAHVVARCFHDPIVEFAPPIIKFMFCL